MCNNKTFGVFFSINFSLNNKISNKVNNFVSSEDFCVALSGIFLE
jgi:hypothetical protein